MPAHSRSWWSARDEEVERFTDNIVPRVAVAWPAHHHVADAAADIAMPNASDASAIARQAARDPDGAFARVQQMQRRLEGQIAAARDWSDDPENPIWADHPFIGPMLENNRAPDLLRLADPVHQDQQRAELGRAAATAVEVMGPRPARSAEDEAFKAAEKSRMGSRWIGPGDVMPPDPLPTHIAARLDQAKNKATNAAHGGPWGGRPLTDDLRRKLLMLTRDQTSGSLSPAELERRRTEIRDQAFALSRRPWWRDEFSDGCSAPALLKIPEFAQACLRHDRDYYEATKSRDRADWDFYQNLRNIARDADILNRSRLEDMATLYYEAVRRFGGPHYGKP